MIHWKTKISGFILGLSIGILIGAGFFLIKLNDIFSSLKENLLKQPVTILEKKIENKNETDDKKEKSKKNPFKIELKNLPVKYREVDSLINSNNENIDIQTEIIESVKFIRVMCLPPDSASSAEPIELKLEFRKNPLNTKGYVFSGNALYLYGINSSASPEVFCFRNKYYLKLSEDLFEISPQGQEQKPFKRASDEALKKYLD
jgi:hypothetical protein